MAEVNHPSRPRVWFHVLARLAGTMAAPDELRSLDADEALTVLYTAHYRRLVRLAALLLDDVGTSEEVVQDAYVKMHAAWRRLRDPQAVSASRWVG